MEKNFDKCLAHVLKNEGGYVNHPQDPGGHTNKGVTLSTYRAHFGGHKTVDDLKAITDAELRHIYNNGYWELSGAKHLPVGADLVVFDMAVNAGARRARDMYFFVADAWGSPRIEEPITIERFIAKYTNARERYYQSLQTFKTFGNGWMRRCGECMDVALDMARKEFRNANGE